MTISGKLLRGPTGRLLRTSEEGDLARCDCCGPAPGGCPTVILAHPCNIILDPVDCSRDRLPNRYVCLATTIDGEPIDPETSQIFSFSTDLCYYTVPGSTKPFAELTEAEAAVVILGAFESVAGCDDPICGPPPDEPCDCVCYAYNGFDRCGNAIADPVTTFCCFGKEHVNEFGQREICVDFTYTGWLKYEIGSETFHTAPSPDDCGIFHRCAIGGTCIVGYWEFRSLPNADFTPPEDDPCHRACGFSKPCQVRQLIDKRYHPGDTNTTPCFISPSVDAAYSCDNPNHITTPTWSSPGACTIVTGSGGAFGGVEIGDCEVEVLYSSGAGAVDGCEIPDVVGRFRYSQHCDSGSVDYEETQWGRLTNSFCPGAVDGVDICCCSYFDKITEHHEVSIDRPGADDPECFQCLRHLEEVGL